MSWIQTYTGKRFDVLKPRTDDVDITDIAHALSMQCRFNGHIKRFYSVAEHSVLVSRIVEDNYATAARGRYPYDREARHRANACLTALLHDASEAYLGDVVKPVKMLPQLEAFCLIDDDVQTIIEGAFVDKVPDWVRDLIKQADHQMLGSEAEWLLLDGPRSDWGAPSPDPRFMPQLTTKCPPEEAERMFTARFESLAKEAAW